MQCPTCNHGNSNDARFCGVCGSTLTTSTASATGIGTDKLPTVGFGEAIGRGFSNYFTFSGRASRPEYWWWILFTLLIGWIPFASLVTLIPSLAVTSRRFHDIGKSGWLQIMPWAILTVTWVLGFATQQPALYVIGLFAAFASFVALIVWLARKGDEVANKYGPDPRLPISQQPYPPTTTGHSS